MIDSSVLTQTHNGAIRDNLLLYTQPSGDEGIGKHYSTTPHHS